MFERESASEKLCWPEEKISKVTLEMEKGGRQIRQYFYSNLEKLRQIPQLALEADGRGGWSDNRHRAYNDCVYPLCQENGTYGSYDLVIELRTGEILAYSGGFVYEDEVFNVGFRKTMDFEVFDKLAHLPQNYRFDIDDMIMHLSNQCNVLVTHIWHSG